VVVSMCMFLFFAPLFPDEGAYKRYKAMFLKHDTLICAKGSMLVVFIVLIRCGILGVKSVCVCALWK
jgi:hypothetical protein